MAPPDLITEATRLLGAFLLTLPVAWNRELYGRTVGLRTFPLVSAGACGFVLLSLHFIPESGSDAMARILQGLMSGIGFVGGGAILKSGGSVEGTASAASIWVTGAIGAAVGMGQWQLAAALAVLNFITIKFLSQMKQSEDE